MPRSTEPSRSVPSIPSRVPERDIRSLAGVLEPIVRVLADRLQHAKPVVLAVHLHERLVNERLQFVDDHLARVSADGFGVHEGAPAGEDGHAPEQTLLRVRQQRVAPVNRRAQRLLPLGSVARAGGEEL